jgi:hypothetical protein
LPRKKKEKKHFIMKGTAAEAVLTDDERTDTDAEDTVTDVDEKEVLEDEAEEGDELKVGGNEEMLRVKNLTFKRAFVLAVYHDGELIVTRNVENRTRLQMRMLPSGDSLPGKRLSSPVDSEVDDGGQDEGDERDENAGMGGEEEEEDEAMFTGKVLTARQRALAAGDGMDELMSLPMDTEIRKKELTEEQQQRKSELAEKRRVVYLKQQEEEKVETISKLLQKQTKTRKRHHDASDVAAPTATVILYRSIIRDGHLCNTVSIPKGLGLPPCFAYAPPVH